MLLKKRELADCQALYPLITHPDVFPYVRNKPGSYEEYLFITKQMIEAEEQGDIISRTILDEWGAPIGTITLYDIEKGCGFLGTWLGKDYHGKGYNRAAKDAFFQELFSRYSIERIYLRIRIENIRSQKAAEKLPYASSVDSSMVFTTVRLKAPLESHRYYFYEITKDAYTMYRKQTLPPLPEDFRPLEA